MIYYIDDCLLSDNKTVKNDIALLRLSKSANLNEEDTNIICLPAKSEDNNYDKASCTVAGWGDTCM